MTRSRGHDLRAASIRVALVAAAVVVAAYLVVALAVYGIVTQGLTSQLDARLSDALHQIATQPPPGPEGFGAPPIGPRFGPALLVWTVGADGTVFTNTSDAALPDAYRTVVGPETISVGSDQVRVEGAPAGPGRVIVGLTMAGVGAAQATLVVAEIAIAPVLVLFVFFGAFAIGHRVAAPIEASRRRQLEFTADASHELRTPLSVIEAETTLALARDRDASWYRAAFGRIDGESKRMRRLLDDLLWLARFDAARGSPDAAPVDLGVLAAQTADRFRSVAEARDQVLSVDVSPQDAIVVAPAEWLDRLLGVLLDNACKFSPRGGEVRVSVGRTGGRVNLAVDDAGPGIPADERERIFDRFHRATDSTGGTGLGLAIGDAIVRGTGGRWRIASSTSGGASMSVSWPAALARGHVPDVSTP